MAVTAKQIAQRLGLSEATVSLALNGRPGVSALTKRRVLYCAREMGYDLAKRERRLTSAKNVFLIRHVRSIFGESPFHAEIQAATEKALIAQGHHFASFTVNAFESIPNQLQMLVANGCDGIIVLGTEMRAAEWQPYASLGIPLVLLDHYSPRIDASCVTINNRQGAFLATSALLAEGRGRPGHLTTTFDIANFRERADGFYDALREAGRSASGAIVHRLGPNVEEAEHDMAALIESGEPLANSYFADVDQIAIGAVRALRSHGIRVPQDVSVIGFDDIEMARYLEPPLSTIQVDKVTMCRVAVGMLLQSMDEDTMGSPVRVEIGTTLIRRGTTR